MKFITIIFLLFTTTLTFAQRRGFEFLSYTKSSLEGIINEYASVIPDSSIVFKKYYIELARNYNKAKASYDGYRGYMKDCLLNNNSKKKIQDCLQAKTINVESNLDSLDNLLKSAYIEAYSLGITGDSTKKYTGKNVGILTGDFIKNLLDTLINGGVKLWDESQKIKKQYKDDFFSNLTNKDYDLLAFSELIKKKVVTTSAK